MKPQDLCGLFATHRAPDTIVSDSGSGFTSRVFKEFATSYHPSSNRKAERAFRTLKEYLREPSTLPTQIRESKVLVNVNIYTYTTSCHRRSTQ